MNPSQRRAIERAIRAEEKTLLRWLAKRLGDADAAKDVAQSVFLRVWAFAEKSEIENPRALLFKTAANLALNELKRRSRFQKRHFSPGQYDDDDPLDLIASTAPSPERHFVLREDVEATMAAINALPPQSRRAFIMSRFQELSYREIAEAMKVSESSVEKYMITALKELRAVLKPEPQKKADIVDFQAHRGRGKSGGQRRKG